MAQDSKPNPAPFFLEGGPVGVALFHGFTGSPPEMRLIGDYLNQRGMTVSAPLLPGHGTEVAAMNRCQWTDWTGHAAEALSDLKERCETLFVGGLSMGSLLTLYLAAHHADVAGAILYSPAVIVGTRSIHLTPVLKFLIRKIRKSHESDLTDPRAESRLWHYDFFPVPAAHELLRLIREVRRLLPQVTCPLLVVHSTGDQTIHPDSARYTYERAGSTEKELVTLHNSGHCLTVDSEWEDVAERTYRFIREHLPENVRLEA